MSTLGESPRRLALDALLRVDEGAFAHILLPETLRRRRLAPRDRAQVTDLVYGSIRMRRTIDHLLGEVSSRPIADLEDRVRAALRLGAYQLLSGVAPHAAVGETVNLVGARARGFVNGVLRGLTRLGPPWPLPAGDDVTSIGIRTSHPDWIVECLVDAFGLDDAIATLEVNDEAPPVTVRVNRSRTTLESVTAELERAGIEVTRGALVDDALLLRHTGDLAAVPAVRDGRVTPQDQTSQAVVALLDPQAGERILDLASAPGGKATGAAERMCGAGLVVAADLYDGRVRTVARAIDRLRLGEIVMPVVANGTHPPVRDGAFDRVLLDAPCSGLGVLRRRPDARWRVQPTDVAPLAALQRELLSAAARTVRPGGRLVYSVCTLTPQETVDVDEWARDALPELVAQPAPAGPWRAHGRGAILLPSDARTDGMFVIVFERRAERMTVVPTRAVQQVETPVPEVPPPAVEAPAAPRRWNRVGG